MNPVNTGAAITALALLFAATVKEEPNVHADSQGPARAGSLVPVHKTPPELSGCAVVNGGVLIVDDEVVGSVLWCPKPMDRPMPLAPIMLERHKEDRAPYTDKAKLFPFQDFEDIASDRDKDVYLVGSHKGKEGKRHPDREFLLRVAWKPESEELKVEGENYRLLDALEPALRELGIALELTRENIATIVNIEGLAYHGGSLYFGLREPLTPQGKAIMCAGSAPDLFSGETASLETVELDLEGGGVRALDWDPVRRALLVLSGPAEDKGKAEPALWACQPDGTGITLLHRFEKDVAEKKPEGVCRLSKDDSGQLLVVLDGELSATGSEVLFLQDE